MQVNVHYWYVQLVVQAKRETHELQVYRLRETLYLIHTANLYMQLMDPKFMHEFTMMNSRRNNGI